MKILNITKNWFRLFGWGLVWKHKKEAMLFSERMGYRRFLKIGNWRLRILKPNGI